MVRTPHLPSFLPPLKGKIRLSSEQEDLLKVAMDQYPLSGKRPSPKQYEKVMDTLGPHLTGAQKKTAIAAMKNVKPGFQLHEVVPDYERFDPNTDLPPGVALFSMADSGGNHIVLNAARCAYTDIWNHWEVFARAAAKESGKDVPSQSKPLSLPAENASFPTCGATRSRSL